MNFKELLIEPSWKALLAEELDKPYIKELEDFLEEEKKHYTVYPDEKNFFNAFNLTSFEKLKVVIIGQDPYHGASQAHGLAFSVLGNTPFPPSLRNIFTEYTTDLHLPMPKQGDLTQWAKEGVFLINAVLSVRKGQPASHKNRGWERFVKRVIEIINEKKENVVFVLWGADAQKKESFINVSRHLVLKAPHPSPLSSYRGFFGSKPFSKTNEYLMNNKIVVIDWNLDIIR
ncbi:uracil-DNA glycosylase [bacterium]|nr:uracil-DNA glycosylase [bacterium]MBU1883731.1 uracil-DNA glycosylase [bacterium]